MCSLSRPPTGAADTPYRYACFLLAVLTHRFSLAANLLCCFVRFIVEGPLQLGVKLQLKNEVDNLLVHKG